MNNITNNTAGISEKQRADDIAFIRYKHEVLNPMWRKMREEGLLKGGEKYVNERTTRKRCE